MNYFEEFVMGLPQIIVIYLYVTEKRMLLPKDFKMVWENLCGVYAGCCGYVALDKKATNIFQTAATCNDLSVPENDFLTVPKTSP